MNHAISQQFRHGTRAQNGLFASDGQLPANKKSRPGQIWLVQRHPVPSSGVPRPSTSSPLIGQHPLARNTSDHGSRNQSAGYGRKKTGTTRPARPRASSAGKLGSSIAVANPSKSSMSAPKVLARSARASSQRCPRRIKTHAVAGPGGREETPSLAREESAPKLVPRWPVSPPPPKRDSEAHEDKNCQSRSGSRGRDDPPPPPPPMPPPGPPPPNHTTSNHPHSNPS